MKLRVAITPEFERRLWSGAMLWSSSSREVCGTAWKQRITAPRSGIAKGGAAWYQMQAGYRRRSNDLNPPEDGWRPDSQQRRGDGSY